MQVEDKLVVTIFALFFMTSLLINMDHGSIPAATDAIMRDFSLSRVELGTLGSIIYLGLTAGSLFSGFCL